MEMYVRLLLQNSLSGTVLILLILLFRRFTGNLSRAYVHVLWLVLLTVLLIPPIAVSPVGTMRDFFSDAFAENMLQAAETAQTQTGTGLTPHEMSGAPLAETFAGPVASERGKEHFSGGGMRGVPKWMVVVWAFGASFLAFVCLMQWGMLKRRVRGAVFVQRGVWKSGHIDVPFVMPGVPAKIYIPQGLEQKEGQLADILAHERAHIRHGDHIVKCAAMLALGLHWFNPLVWLAVRRMSLDMEMLCDERVLRGREIAEKQRYSQTLLDYACQGSGFAPAVYFGEGGTRDRIYHIFKVKKLCGLASLLLVLLLSGCGLSFVTVKDAALGEKELQNEVTESPEDEADELEAFIGDAVTLYLTGQFEELNRDYMTQNFRVESDCAFEEVEIVSVTCPDGGKERGETEISVTAKGDGILTCMDISVKKVTSENGADEWRITGWGALGDAVNVMKREYEYIPGT